MKGTERTPWEQVTREERFFTSFLFHDMRAKSEPLWNKLRDKLNLPGTKVVDVGYEVCFFRDAHCACPKLIEERQPDLEKQTFDLVLWLNTGAMVIIEAKAQQSFRNKQLKDLKNARRIILAQSVHNCPDVHLVALCSSKYKMKDSTKKKFDGILRWTEIANAYSNNKSHYFRADCIYRH